MGASFSPAIVAKAKELVDGHGDEVKFAGFKSAMECAVMMIECFLLDTVKESYSLPVDLPIGWGLYHPGARQFSSANVQIVPQLSPETCPLTLMPPSVQNHFLGREDEFYKEVNEFMRRTISAKLLSSGEIVIEESKTDPNEFTVSLIGEIEVPA